MKRIITTIFPAVLTVVLAFSFAIAAMAGTEEIIANYRSIGSTDWSPDGRYIAFSAWPASIYVVDVETGAVKSITAQIPNIETEATKKYPSAANDLQGKGSPSFSADGTEVYFSQNNAYATNDTDFHFSYVRKVNIDTGAYETVLEDGYFARLSKDGKYLLYSKNEIYDAVYNFETGEVKSYYFPEGSGIPCNNYMCIGGSGSFSPDNSNFLTYLYALNNTAQFNELNDQWKIYKVDMATGAAELVPIPGGLNYTHPRYSPDGTKIFVTTWDFYPPPSETRDANGVLYEAAFKDFHLFYLSEGAYGEMLPIETYQEYLQLRKTNHIWQLPDNHDSYMGFENPNSGKPENLNWIKGAGIFDSATGTFTALDAPNYYSAFGGCWSPDGTKVCYVLRNENDDFCALYIYNLTTGRYKAVVPEYTITNPIAVSDEEPPAAFSIVGNYPNPFNPTTTIEFSLEKQGDVSLDIFNITGQKVCTLESSVMAPGTHSVVWNGRDGNGIPVSSGVYICRLKMGAALETRPMLLAK